ncbi:hypothetical protein EYF80_040820 [Liparis tanakae]|uniref:Uncharacterized protein n=1 Tax=Liparis tanakae TaxID=230148 RepID=A0A4Z2G7T6_9TELE|nr:hypothetical protein EYF80_040820 [Liparis tanakae]
MIGAEKDNQVNFSPSNQEESCNVTTELEAELEQLSSALAEKGAELRDVIKEEKQRKEAELQGLTWTRTLVPGQEVTREGAMRPPHGLRLLPSCILLVLLVLLVQFPQTGSRPAPEDLDPGETRRPRTL